MKKIKIFCVFNKNSANQNEFKIGTMKIGFHFDSLSGNLQKIKKM